MRRIFFFFYILNDEVNIIGEPPTCDSRCRSVPSWLHHSQPCSRYFLFHLDSLQITVSQPKENSSQTYRYTLAKPLPASPSVGIGNYVLIQLFKTSQCLLSDLMPSILYQAQFLLPSLSSPSHIQLLFGRKCVSISGLQPTARFS